LALHEAEQARLAADAQAAHWLGSLPQGASPRMLPPLPVFGYPGWLPANERAEFYEDGRFFRPAPGAGA
jgi:hypothetical protein